MESLPSNQLKHKYRLLGSWDLRAKPDQVGHCRRLTRDILLSLDLEYLIEDGMLLVSELSTNAIQHSKGNFRLRWHIGENLRCEVYDESAAIPTLNTDEPEDPSQLAEDGRGMRLMDKVSCAYGFYPEGGGKTVWFELPLEGKHAT